MQKQKEIWAEKDWKYLPQKVKLMSFIGKQKLPPKLQRQIAVMMLFPAIQYALEVSYVSPKEH